MRAAPALAALLSLPPLAQGGAAAKDCFAAYPKHYVAPRGTVTVDGSLDDAAWATAPWTTDFVDIANDLVPRLETKAKILWDDTYLYVAGYLKETQLWANITQDNEVIFHDNDFEVFVDPYGTTHNYRELEVNALGKQWSLLLNKPYGDGGSENSRRVNPTGGFDLQAVVAVSNDGQVNDPNVTATHWIAEIAIPFTKLGRTPEQGAYWRINFSRVQWRAKVVDSTKYQKLSGAEDNWVYGPIGVVAMHNPERWPVLQLGGTEARDPTWPARHAAAALYNAEHKAKKAHGEFKPLADLTLPSLCANTSVSASSATDFTATATYGGYAATIRADRLLTVAPVVEVRQHAGTAALPAAHREPLRVAT